MATTVEDDDTLTGVQQRWTADSALATAVPGGLHAGRLTPQAQQPYAGISCTQGPTPNSYLAPAITGAGYHDYRHIVITIVGKKADVTAALAPARAAFEWQPKAPLVLTIPNTRKLMVVRPLPGNAKLEEDPTRRQGEDLWRGILDLEVWTVRLIP